uniref:Alternative protein NSD1 n=1 Tax=Homo sapiens TaxID=9606 RepID=L0R5C2_HUMAN|nr:alternative protein NSD1 [Homo sapiens]
MRRCQCWSQVHGLPAKVWGICRELLRKAVCQILFRHLGKQQPLQRTPGKLLNHSPRPDFFLSLLPRPFYMSQQLRPQEELLQGLSRPQGLLANPRAW